MVPEVPKALADMPLEAGIAREEDLGVVHRTVREARHTGQQEGLEAERHTVLDVVRQVQRAEVAGSPLAEGNQAAAHPYQEEVQQEAYQAWR